MSAEQGNEDLKTLVSGLKAVRESKGFSLEDVHEKTRISIKILDAIEKGEFHLVPPGLYTRNFIRSYADFLEVDSQAILAHFKDERDRAAPPVLHHIDCPPASEGRLWKYLAAGSGVLILIAILAWFFYSDAGKSLSMPGFGLGDAGREASQGVLPRGVTVAVGGDPTLPSVTKPSPAAPDALPPQVARPGDSPSPLLREDEGGSGPYQLMIEAKERTWLRLRTDNGETYSLMMNPGERLNRKARERFTLDIGNAAGVTVFFQGRMLENLGKPGQVVHLSLPSESAR